MQLSMTPISAATSASWQHPVESCYAAKSDAGLDACFVSGDVG